MKGEGRKKQSIEGAGGATLVSEGTESDEAQHCIWGVRWPNGRRNEIHINQAVRN